MPISAAEFKANAAKCRKTVEKEYAGLGVVRLRALSAGDAQRFQAEVKRVTAAGGDAEALAFTLIALSWVDADDAPLFAEAEGVEMAKALTTETYNAIAADVLKLNGLNASAVDDALKNSESIPDAPTPTGSPESSATPTSI